MCVLGAVVRHAPLPLSPGGGHRHFPYRRPPLSTILEFVFDTDGWWGTRVEYPCPRAVWLTLRQVFPPRRVRYDDVPLRVRAAGIDVARVERAELYAWQQTSTGDWFAEVQVIVTNPTERAEHEAWLFVPAAAVRPREVDTGTAPHADLT